MGGRPRRHFSADGKWAGLYFAGAVFKLEEAVDAGGRSHSCVVVEPEGLEPSTSSMPLKRSPG